MNLKTIIWKNNRISIIDQTRLPTKLEYLHIDDLKTLWQAIKQLRVRGAPVLAAAAALGVFLGIKDSPAKTYRNFQKELHRVIDYIASSRPTAINLFWGLERMAKTAKINQQRPIKEIKKILLAEAKKIIKEDMSNCRRMAENGADLIKQNDKILTICNTGVLATTDYGTALGVIYRAKAQGKKVSVFACETRPLLQGSRLTAWELKRKGIKVTLICDSMAATIMKNGLVDKVFVGADRIAGNGDTANKVGTYNLAVLANFHRIPFYVIAPLSSFDPTLKTGKVIPIEQRSAKEVTELFFKQPIAPKGVRVYNPAFDITPCQLISAIVTEKGIIRPPYRKNIMALFNSR